MNLDLLTSGTPDDKPWLNIVANSLNCNICNTKYPATATFPSLNCGVIYIATSLQIVATPVGTSAGIVTYSDTLDEVVASGVPGPNTAMFTTDLVTWTQILTNPTANPTLVWSPTLGYYGYLNAGGTQVYTSVDHVVYVAGTALPTASTGVLFWSNVFNKFFAGNADASHQIFDSSDGKTYTARASTRQVQDFSESSKLNIIVAVGNNGPQYSEDGKTWVDSPQSFSSDGVAWSDTYGVFVTVPRNGTKTECWRSSDGINWSMTTPFGGANNIRTIEWSQDMNIFVAAGDNEYVAVSLDGLTWDRLAVLSGLVDFYFIKYIKEWGSFVIACNSNNIGSNIKLFKSGV